MTPDALTPIEERELNQPADHPSVILNPDQWRAVFGTAAPRDVFDVSRESEAA